MSKITDYVEAYNVGGFYIGYASILFRENNDPNTDLSSRHGFPYVLNSKNDGWFRKTEGIAQGYGLCINSIKITSRKPQLMGKFICYKAQIDYTSHEETPASDKFWVLVHQQFDIQEVLQYIEDNKKNWYP